MPSTHSITMDQPAKTDLSILITDDMRNMRRTIKNMLLSLGYRKMEEAADGDEAISLIERYQNVPLRKFHLIILDWNMPRVHGIEVLKFIKKNPIYMNTAVLMITAENWAVEIMEAAEDHVDGYIVKPFVAKTLENKIKGIMDKVYNPPEKERLLRDAEKYFYDEKYDEAKIKLEELLKIQPESARAYRYMGKISMINNDYSSAEELFRKAIDYNKDYTKAYKDLADVLVKTDRGDEAIKILEKAAEVNPRNLPRLLMIGNLYLDRGKYGDLLTLFNKANSAGLTMKHRDLDMLQAHAWLGMKKINKAVDIFKVTLSGSDEKNRLKKEAKNIVEKVELDDADKKNLTQIIDAI